MPHVQSTVEPTYLQKVTVKPANTPEYDYKLDEPINGFEPAIAYDPYKISVTTQNTHQHLTETTPFVQSPQPTKHFHSTNVTTVSETVPTLAFGDIIPTTATATSPKPLHEILHSMNRTSLQLLLTKLKENNYLPKTFTMNKFDNSLKTLSKVLSDLKKAPKPVKNYEHPLALVPSHAPSQPAPHPPSPPKFQPIKGNYEHAKPIHPIKSNRGIHFFSFSLSLTARNFFLYCCFSYFIISIFSPLSVPGPGSGKMLIIYFFLDKRLPLVISSKNRGKTQSINIDLIILDRITYEKKHFKRN